MNMKYNQHLNIYILQSGVETGCSYVYGVMYYVTI